MHRAALRYDGAWLFSSAAVDAPLPVRVHSRDENIPPREGDGAQDPAARMVQQFGIQPPGSSVEMRDNIEIADCEDVVCRPATDRAEDDGAVEPDQVIVLVRIGEDVLDRAAGHRLEIAIVPVSAFGSLNEFTCREKVRPVLGKSKARP